MSTVLRRAAFLALLAPAVVRPPAAQLASAAPASGVPRAGGVPTPESSLGFRVGDDFRLATYDEAITYLKKLDTASDRIQLVEVGKTSNGAAWYVALISSPANLTAVARYREIAQRLAHPRGLSDVQARSLAREGRAIVHIDGGLHATEAAGAQHTIQLAHDLVANETDPETKAILDNVILVLWPSINPDGQNMVATWYRSNLGTPFEVSAMPELYQKYVGHDNNRDGYMINMIESRVVTRVTREWEPQIFYNHHQTAPFPARIWIPPFAEPVSEFVHPLMWRTVNLIGMAMAQALEERGQKGAIHMGDGFDNWYPGFMDHANNFHNIASFLTETGLYRYATPHFYTTSDFPAPSQDLRAKSLYSSPWEGGWWRLRDAVDYMITASMAVLDVAAKYREDILYNRYQAGRDVIAEYTKNPPYAYFVPQEQRDPVAAVEMLRRLAFNGIEISQLQRPVTFEGQQYPRGTWVIPMDQENANFVRQLFAVQKYPDLREYPEGPPDQPYDVSGWTLPYLFDVRVIEAASPIDSVRPAMAPVNGTPRPWNAASADGSPFDSPNDLGFDVHPVATAIDPPAGTIRGSGPALAVDPAENNAFRAVNRAWREGGSVRFAAGRPASGTIPARSGRYLITGLSDNAQQALVRDLALRTERTGVTGAELRRPRVGLYRPWNASMDEGWTRWLADMYELSYTSLYNPDILAGALRDRYDVIVIADMGAGTIMNGFARGSVPARYAGGIGAEGVRELDQFVRTGGTLVTINASSNFAIEQLRLPVENVAQGLRRNDFSVSGSILAVTTDPSHPVMSGMPEQARAVIGSSPVFSTKDGFEGSILAKYQEAGSPLLSGYLLGEKYLNGYAAAVDVKHGAGRVVLLGMRPQWRGQPFGNFRILFNAALYSADLAAATPANPGFWKKPARDSTTTPTPPGTGRGGGRGGSGAPPPPIPPMPVPEVR
jgi:hypothetical protein